MQKCAKCGDPALSLRRDATCELHPAVGFKSPCLLNERARRQEEAAAGPSLIPIKTSKSKSKRTKERKSNNAGKGA